MTRDIRGCSAVPGRGAFGSKSPWSTCRVRVGSSLWLAITMALQAKMAMLMGLGSEPLDSSPCVTAPRAPPAALRDKPLVKA